MFTTRVLRITNGPLAVSGFFPLYLTKQEAIRASPDKTYHTHTLNGKSYFMPDGVKHYHGDYKKTKPTK